MHLLLLLLQPICGACEDVCNPEFRSIEVTLGALPTKPTDFTPINTEYNSTATAVNTAATPQTLSVTFAVEQALTGTLSFASNFDYQVN